MRLALAQINAVVGDLDGNRERILAGLEEARAAGADLVLFPELAVTGYPPEDLLLRPGFVRAAERVAARDREAPARGSPRSSARPGSTATSTTPAPSAPDGEVQGALPQALPAELRRLRRGPLLRARPRAPPAAARRHARRADDLRGHLAARAAGDRPRARGRRAAREHLRLAVPRRQGRGARGDARHAGARQLRFLAFCNLVGGQDELVFDGHSVVLDDEGEVLARAPGFEEALLVVDLDPSEAIGRRLRDVRRRALARERDERARAARASSWRASDSRHKASAARSSPFEPELEQMRRALVLGAARLRRQERLRRRRARALGRDRLGARRGARRRGARAGARALRLDAVALLVRGHAIDARRLAESLGCDFREIPIEDDRRARSTRRCGRPGRASPPRTCRRACAA